MIKNALTAPLIEIPLSVSHLCDDKLKSDRALVGNEQRMRFDV